MIKKFLILCTSEVLLLINTPEFIRSMRKKIKCINFLVNLNNKGQTYQIKVTKIFINKCFTKSPKISMQSTRSKLVCVCGIKKL